MESPLARSLVPHFRALAERALQSARDCEVSCMPRWFGVPGVEVMHGPVGPNEPSSMLVVCCSQAHGQETIVYLPGGREGALVDALSRWAEAAPGEAARFFLDVMTDALMAGATPEDLVFTIGNAVASAVIET